MFAAPELIYIVHVHIEVALSGQCTVCSFVFCALSLELQSYETNLIYLSVHMQFDSYLQV